MLRTLKNSPVHFPIFETGLLIRDTAQKIQQNDSVPSKMSRFPITLGQPQQSLRGQTEREEKDASAGRPEPFPPGAGGSRGENAGCKGKGRLEGSLPVF